MSRQSTEPNAGRKNGLCLGEILLRAFHLRGKLGRLGIGPRAAARLTVVERIALAPRHQLALVEADGERLLVATTPDGSPAFYLLAAKRSRTESAYATRRVSA